MFTIVLSLISKIWAQVRIRSFEMRIPDPPVTLNLLLTISVLGHNMAT